MSNIKTFCLCLLFFLSYSSLISQTGISADLPNVIRPSPTVSSLMKFEEIPVSTYTGVPDINVPFYSGKLKNGFPIDIKLSYHSASINVKQPASDCGLGWNLIAGGTISRTVKGLPDEILILDGGQTGKVGIYQTGTSNHINRFYEYLKKVEDGTIGPSEYLQTNEVNTYLWDTNVRNKYDTEHDLYQYNFLGHTGRFIMIKNASGQLEVKKADYNALKIINNYNPSTYELISFTIVDDYGNRFLFDIFETTRVTQLTSSWSQWMIDGNNISGSTLYDFKSAFHLSKIYDSNGILQAELKYHPEPVKETTSSASTTLNVEVENKLSSYYTNNMLQFDGMGFQWNPLPSRVISSSQNATQTRKLSEIQIIGDSKIFFEYSIGRSDSGYQNANESCKLSKVSVKSWNGNTTKKYVFGYDYSAHLLNGHTLSRMRLSQIKEFGNNDIDFLTHDFEYNQQILNDLYTDSYGYFCVSDLSIFLQQNSTEDAYKVCTLDVLTKMKLPTGGSVEFDFESNTYSHIGDEPITDFDRNNENWVFDSASKNFNSRGGTPEYFFTIYTAQNVFLTHQINFVAEDWWFNLYRHNDVTGENIPAGGLSLSGNCIEGDCSRFLYLQPGTYYINFNTGHRDGINASLGVYFKNKPLGTRQEPFETRKYLYGGGIRVKSVKYFESVNSAIPTKEMHYDYRFFGQGYSSSGSRVFPEPVFNYRRVKRECPTVSVLVDPYSVVNEFDFHYDVMSTSDNLSAIRTKGAEIGYKNVTVYESGNGKKEHIYLSPIDYPEEIEPGLHLEPPFLPTLNKDYKRGLLSRESIFDSQNKKIKETENTYNFEEQILTHGLRLLNVDNYPFINYRNWTTYANYKLYLQNCNPCPCYFGYPWQFTYHKLIKESFGWAKLSSSTSKEFFYNTANQPLATVENKTDFEYNNTNQKVKIQTTTSSLGESVVQKTIYTSDLSASAEPNISLMRSRNILSVPLKTESYRSSEKIAEQKTTYKDWGAGFLSPEIILTSKGNNPLENKIRYNLMDTASGNPLEVQKENGIKTCYIWGYNKTQPVAKIENISYVTIPAELISNIQTVSDAINYDENAMLLALNALRVHNALQGTMISTYTYKSGVGISTHTDVNGYRTTYKYDSFGRLENIRDVESNILSENKYHYRTQN